MTILYAGTVGEGVWRSRDDGESFHRLGNGIFVEATVRALAVHPREPRVLYAGTDGGLYRTEDGGDRWERLQTPFDPGQGWPSGVSVWSLLVHPERPETVFAGTCPPAVYRSTDSGATWRKLDVELVQECGGILHPRVTCIVADPEDADTIWVGIEIDGARVSNDGGESWERRDQGLSSMDIHGLAIVPGSPKTLVASTNNDVNISMDGGRTWQPQNVRERFPWSYTRFIVRKADDPRTLFLGNGDGPPGTQGTVQVSRDGGSTWEQASLSQPPNSTIWGFATSPDAPDLVFAYSVSGEVYRSVDAGATWEKRRHEFGELRALAVVAGEGG